MKRPRPSTTGSDADEVETSRLVQSRPAARPGSQAADRAASRRDDRYPARQRSANQTRQRQEEAAVECRSEEILHGPGTRRFTGKSKISGKGGSYSSSLLAQAPHHVRRPTPSAATGQLVIEAIINVGIRAGFRLQHRILPAAAFRRLLMSLCGSLTSPKMRAPPTGFDAGRQPDRLRRDKLPGAVDAHCGIDRNGHRRGSRPGRSRRNRRSIRHQPARCRPPACGWRRPDRPECTAVRSGCTGEQHREAGLASCVLTA